MRLSSTILLALLPSYISAANDQVPIKDKAAGWFDKAKAYVSSAVPEIPNPIDAGAAKVAEYKVEKINIRNYERKLGPKPDQEEEWMIFITGGNKTCHGRCADANLAWNQSVPLLSALAPFNAAKLMLGKIDCEVDEVLCTAWAAAVPSVFHFIFPQKLAGAPTPVSPLHDIRLEIIDTKVEEITSIPRASESSYLKVEEYVGAWHPVDGTLRKLGLLNAMGYVLWGFGSTPSWLIMIGISFFSRQFMSRRAASRPGFGGPPPAVPGNAAPAPGVARAPKSPNPAAGAAKGGQRKRK